MFTDTHTHLYASEFDGDRQALMKKAIAGGVTRFYMPNIDGASIDAMMKVEAGYPDRCFAMMGLHPCHVNGNYDAELATVRQWLDKRPFVAIGEIGIDLYWDKTFYTQQVDAFRRQLDWSLEFDLPVSIHCRSAFSEIMEVLESYTKRPRGIFHCFSGTLEEANRVLALGDFKLGIGGVVTFKNAGLDKVVEAIDLKHLVLETDAPYLAPVPFRGKRNEPGYLLEIARKVAALKDVDMETVAKITSDNAASVFTRMRS
jgi:TatD DNase family protein